MLCKKHKIRKCRKDRMAYVAEIDSEPDEETKITPNSLVLSLELRFYF